MLVPELKKKKLAYKRMNIKAFWLLKLFDFLAFKHLDESVSTSCNETVSQNIHAIYGVRLAPLQLSYLRAVIRLPIADLAVRACRDDLALVWAIAHRTEHGVRKDDLTTNKSPVDKETRL